MPPEVLSVNRNISSGPGQSQKNREIRGDMRRVSVRTPSSPELGVRTVQIYGRIGAEKPDPEIVMGLASESPFRLARRKLVTIGSPGFDHFVGIGRKTKLLE